MEPRKKRQIRVAGGALMQDGKVLIVQRPVHEAGGGFWEFPGGKIEASESPSQALMREIDEELAIQVRPARDLGWSTHEYDDVIIELNIWICEWQSGEIELREHQGLRWLEPWELNADDLSPADRPFIPRLQTSVKV